MQNYGGKQDVKWVTWKLWINLIEHHAGRQVIFLLMFVYLKNIRVENAPILLDYGIILNMYVSCTETQTDWKKAEEQIN